eukprot:4854800-Amphidinium_carterae.1
MPNTPVISHKSTVVATTLLISISVYTGGLTQFQHLRVWQVCTHCRWRGTAIGRCGHQGTQYLLVLIALVWASAKIAMKCRLLGFGSLVWARAEEAV